MYLPAPAHDVIQASFAVVCGAFVACMSVVCDVIKTDTQPLWPNSLGVYVIPAT